MSEKNAKLANKVAHRFGFPRRKLKRGGLGKSHKVKAVAYRRMRLVLDHAKTPTEVNFDAVIDEWKRSG